MINGADTDGDTVPDGQGGHSLVSDAQPYYDDCSTRDAVSMTGKNIGDELNAAGLSWGWFQGGFRPTTTFATATGGTQPTSTFTPTSSRASSHSLRPPTRGCATPSTRSARPSAAPGASTPGPTNYGNKDDYIPHHEPFQYYASTANPHHLPPASLSAIGTDTQTFTNGVPQFDTANHQYDTSDFDSLVGAITHGYLSPDHLPAVSFLKAPGYQDGHAGYSDPLDEQQFIVNEINALEQHPGLVQHRGRHLLRRLRRLVRPRLQRRPQRVEHLGGRDPTRTAGLPDRHGALRRHDRAPAAGRPERPVRLRAPPAAAGHLAVGEAQLRRPHPDRPEFDHQVRRGQLAAAADQRLVRRHRRIAEQHVRLQHRQLQP